MNLIPYEEGNGKGRGNDEWGDMTSSRRWALGQSKDERNYNPMIKTTPVISIRFYRGTVLE